MNPVRIGTHVRLDFREAFEALDETLQPRVCTEAAWLEQCDLLDLMPHTEICYGYLIATGEPLVVSKLCLASVQIVRQALEVGRFEFLEVPIVAQAHKASVKIHTLFDDDIDEPSLCRVCPEQVMFTGKVAENSATLRQLDISINEVRQIRVIEAQRLFFIKPHVS